MTLILDVDTDEKWRALVDEQVRRHAAEQLTQISVNPVTIDSSVSLSATAQLLADLAAVDQLVLSILEEHAPWVQRRQATFLVMRHRNPLDVILAAIEPFNELIAALSASPLVFAAFRKQRAEAAQAKADASKAEAEKIKAEAEVEALKSGAEIERRKAEAEIKKLEAEAAKAAAEAEEILARTEQLKVKHRSEVADLVSKASNIWNGRISEENVSKLIDELDVLESLDRLGDGHPEVVEL